MSIVFALLEKSKYENMYDCATTAIFKGMDNLMALTQMASQGKIDLFEAHKQEKDIMCSKEMNETYIKIANVGLEESEKKLKKEYDKKKKFLESFA